MTRRDVVLAALTVPLLGAAAASPALGLGPILSARHWLGERPSFETLRGRVVLVDVFTFECINCVRITPELQALYRNHSRSDLAIVAVHTPEVPSYQGRAAYVAREARAAGLPWPIAIDNDERIWNAYGVSAWPTQLLFDRSGRLRRTFVGDGLDAGVATAVRTLLGAGAAREKVRVSERLPNREDSENRASPAALSGHR